jgi:hypothetical protein
MRTEIIFSTSNMTGTLVFRLITMASVTKTKIFENAIDDGWRSAYYLVIMISNDEADLIVNSNF